jgi:hypothetical protein
MTDNANGLRFVNLAEMRAVTDRPMTNDELRAQPTLQWGMWRYNRNRRTLFYGRGEYEVDLDRCRTSGEVLDWIIQLNQKSWTTPEDIGHLVEALDVLLHPQFTLCSGGSEKRIADVPQLLRENEVSAHRWREWQAIEDERAAA